MGGAGDLAIVEGLTFRSWEVRLLGWEWDFNFLLLIFLIIRSFFLFPHPLCQTLFRHSFFGFLFALISAPTPDAQLFKRFTVRQLQGLTIRAPLVEGN